MRSLLLAFVLAAAVGCHGMPSGGLPYYESSDFTPKWSDTGHRVGDFSLVTQTGAPITGHDLAGRVHVASFIYTRCSAICPTLVSNLARVQRQMTDTTLVIISYSVTPDVDTPAALAAFGEARGVDPARWKLVTGDRDQIYDLARRTYFASDERVQTSLDGPNGFLHTEKLVLVDRQGKLRGVYDGTQPFEIDHLIEDARRLIGND